MIHGRIDASFNGVRPGSACGAGIRIADDEHTMRAKPQPATTDKWESTSPSDAMRPVVHKATPQNRAAPNLLRPTRSALPFPHRLSIAKPPAKPKTAQGRAITQSCSKLELPSTLPVASFSVIPDVAHGIA